MNCGRLFQKQKQCLPEELEVGDCWIAISLADSSGLILAARVGNTPMNCQSELVISSEGKTACKRFNSDDWGGYERVLPPEILHYIGKDKTQRLRERMALLDNKPDDGIANRISLARCGSKPR